VPRRSGSAPSATSCRDGVDAADRRRPGERRAAVDVGVDRRPALHEPLQRGEAVVARRPGERLVERLLRIGRVRCPRGEAAVRAVEAAVVARRAVGEHRLDQLDVPEPGGGAQVARVHAALRHPLGRLASRERRASREAGSGGTAGTLDELMSHSDGFSSSMPRGTTCFRIAPTSRAWSPPRGPDPHLFTARRSEAPARPSHSALIATPMSRTASRLRRSCDNRPQEALR